ncbi:ATPase [Promicromonospora sp. NPDC057138]|uniref:ATPase n=1 Tax=Promicromonospora sp. NPDC057138 TaxID=3346031 RepID=UPI003638CBD3
MSVETAGWPRAEAVVRDDGSGRVTVDGQTVPVYGNSLGEARSEVMRLITEYSTSIGLAVEVQAEGPEGLTGLTVYPDGRVVQDGGAGAAQAAQAAHAAQAAQAAPRRASVPTPVAPAPAHLARPAPGPMSGQLPGLAAGPASMSLPASAPAPGSRPAQVAEQQSGALPGLTPSGPQPSAESLAPRRASVMGRAGSPPAPETDRESPFGPGPAPDGTRREGRRSSFVTKDRLDEPATQGFRGALSRIGLRVRPNEAERGERADEKVVSQHWPGPRTISIVNGKGGAGKTPATVLLSAVFSSHGGSGVVAWDNNQTRGTLGWRTEQGPHESTLLDLIPQTEHFLGPAAQLADLAWFVHHQSRDRFDVLRSKPMALAHEQRISSEDVDAIHAVLAKYYRMIFIDSGNDESDPMWLRMIDHTDQLVVATSTRDDHAEAGALLLEALANRGEHMAELARKAVVVVSQSDPKATAADMRRVAQGYRSLAREVVTIPFDPAMVDGQLVYRALRPLTRRAWLAAGAALARGF